MDMPWPKYSEQYINGQPISCVLTRDPAPQPTFPFNIRDDHDQSGQIHTLQSKNFQQPQMGQLNSPFVPPSNPVSDYQELPFAKNPLSYPHVRKYENGPRFDIPEQPSASFGQPSVQAPLVDGYLEPANINVNLPTSGHVGAWGFNHRYPPPSVYSPLSACSPPSAQLSSYAHSPPSAIRKKQPRMQNVFSFQTAVTTENFLDSTEADKASRAGGKSRKRFSSDSMSGSDRVQKRKADSKPYQSPSKREKRTEEREEHQFPEAETAGAFSSPDETSSTDTTPGYWSKTSADSADIVGFSSPSSFSWEPTMVTGKGTNGMAADNNTFHATDSFIVPNALEGQTWWQQEQQQQQPAETLLGGLEKQSLSQQQEQQQQQPPPAGGLSLDPLEGQAAQQEQRLAEADNENYDIRTLFGVFDDPFTDDVFNSVY